MWPIAFFGTLAITVAATAAVWATPLASVTAPAGAGIINSGGEAWSLRCSFWRPPSLSPKRSGSAVTCCQRLLPLGRKRALLVTGAGVGDLAHAAALSDLADPGREQGHRCADVLRRRGGGKLLLRLPGESLSGSLWPASIAHAVHNSAWGLMVAFTATSSPRAGHQLPPRRLRHRDHRWRRPWSRARQPMMPRGDEKARHDATPPVLEPVTPTAAPPFPGRSSHASSGTRSLASHFVAGNRGDRCPHCCSSRWPCAWSRLCPATRIRQPPAVPTSSQSTPTLTGRCASCASPAWLSASCTTTR